MSETIPLWQAFKAASEGREVEFKNTWGVWSRFNEYAWHPNTESNLPRVFRIKPEPPQVVEFEFEWAEVEGGYIVPGEVRSVLKPLIGKRWKVRCEEVKGE